MSTGLLAVLSTAGAIASVLAIPIGLAAAYFAYRSWHSAELASARAERHRQTVLRPRPQLTFVPSGPDAPTTVGAC